MSISWGLESLRQLPSRYQITQGFPGGVVVKYLPANAGDAGDTGLIPGLGRSPGGGNGNPLHYSCQDNPMDRGASVQSLSCVRLFATPWTAARQASLSITNSRSSPKPRSIESVMPSDHLILCHPLLLLPSIFPSIRVFSNELALHIRWPKYWSFSFNISPSSEHPGLISFRMDWLETGGLQFMGSQRVRHSWACKHAYACTHTTHISVHSHTHTHSAIKRKSFATIWTDLECNIRCEIIQR